LLFLFSSYDENFPSFQSDVDTELVIYCLTPLKYSDIKLIKTIGSK
jgi:hypothetical protein